jgi:hypothetical protein
MEGHNKPLHFGVLNLAELFGFELKRKMKDDELPSFTPSTQDDGAVTVAAGGAYGTYVDLDGTIRSEAELVTRYRDMSLVPECDGAIDEIVNESIAVDDEDIVELNTDELQVSPNIKKVIREEFKNCLNILEFNKYAYDIFRRWYIDGRLYYHVIIDDKNPKDGIRELRFIDPRKIRKIREVQKKRVPGTNTAEVVLTKTVNEYYVYNDKGFNYGSKSVGQGSGTSATGLKIAKDSIVQVVSGLTDTNGTMVLSYLHKGIKALNQLSTLEDALVIYRLSRAPERRIWYIDVGNLPKMKAEQYVRDIMVKHKNRLVYDATTGQVRDDRKFMTMLEDYWLPRREGGRGTEVTTLPGGQNLGQMDDVLYFQKKFLQTLNVPISRLNSDSLFSLGRATEITRDEIKFSRFIMRLRARFSHLFTKMLEKQLVLKGVMTADEFKVISSMLKYEFTKDNYFNELKDAEIGQQRVELARNYQDMAGKYYSHNWIRKHVLKQSDDDVEEQDKMINGENQSQDPRWINPTILQNQQMANPPEQPDPNQPTGEQGSDEDAQKREQVRQAMIFVDEMKKRKGNRSIQDEAKYKAAVQVIAKNEDIVAQLGAGGGQQQQ